MKVQFVLPGCSLLLWGLFLLIGLSMQVSGTDHVLHYRWLPALMTLGSLALVLLSQVKYARIAAQICAVLTILFFVFFFMTYTGGI